MVIKSFYAGVAKISTLGLLSILLSLICPFAMAGFGGLTCEGSQMVLSCGNLRCDTWLGENAETCPADCTNYSVASYNFQEICTTSSTLLEPASESELVEALHESVAQGQHVKIVGRLHSTNSVICNDGVIISTKKLDTIYGLETYNDALTVKVQAGVTMGQLSDWLSTKGKSLGYTLMGFRGISIAGAIGTGAHGSSPKYPSVLLSLVESMEVLRGDNTRVEYNRLTTDPKIWKALNANLGLLGVVLNLRLKVRDQFALKTKVDSFKDELLLSKVGNWNLIKDCDFGQMVWFPGAKTVFRTCGHEAPLATARLDPGARAAFVDFGVPSGLFGLAKSVVHGGSCHSGFNCGLEKIRVADLKLNPPMKVRFGSRERSVTAATGLSHRMMASDLNANTFGFTQNDWALAIPVSRLDQALRAIQEKLSAHHLCLPFAGIIIRYGQTHSLSWLAHSSAEEGSAPGEPLAFLDMVVYSPVGLTDAERLEHEFPETDVIKMLIDDYGARLHWAKNKDALIQHELQTGRWDESIRQFLDVVDSFDPKGIFSNSTAEMLRDQIRSR